MRGFQYYDMEDAPSHSDVGTIKSWNTNLPLGYQNSSESKYYKVTDPRKRQSAYKRCQTYVSQTIIRYSC